MERLVLKDILLEFYDRVALEIDLFSADLPFAVLGGGGAGKSNFIKVIAGLEYIKKGEIFINGVEVGGHPIKERGLSLVSRRTPLFWRKSVRKNLEYPLKKLGMSRAEIDKKVSESAKKYGLDLDKKCKDLGKAECADVFFARAMIKNPQILLLDEVGSLWFDAEHFLELLRQSGVFFVLATYDFDLAKKSGVDRFVVLRLGEIIFDGNSQSVFNSDNEYIKKMCLS